MNTRGSIQIGYCLHCLTYEFMLFLSSFRETLLQTYNYHDYTSFIMSFVLSSLQCAKPQYRGWYRCVRLLRMLYES